jgi:hypothetical protein
MRISRGTPRSEKHEGHLYVLFDDDLKGDVSPSESSALISDLRERTASLERPLEAANERDRENRRLLAAALERIPPQLEAPTEATGEPGPGVAGQSPQEPTSPVSGRGWWEFWRWPRPT